MIEEEKPSWRLERQVPLAAIGMLLMQLLSGLIWASQLNARVETLEQQTPAAAVMSEKFARMEERLEGLKQNMESVKRELDHLTDHLLKP